MSRPAGAVALVVAALAAAVTGCSGSDETTESAATTSTGRPVTEAPTLAGWSSVGGISVPIGSHDGPSRASGGPFTGFSHTPQGAALAAITQSVQLSTASDTQWSTLLPVLAVPGPGRDQYAASRALVSAPSGIDPSVAPAIAGYVIGDYRDDRASVQVIQRFPDTSLAATTTTVAWAGGDWKLDLPTTEQAAAATALPELPPTTVRLEGPK